MTAQPAVGIARFTEAGVTVVAPGSRLWCASVLKPLYFWAAAATAEPHRWTTLAEPAVTTSANAPTTALWEEWRGEPLLDEVRRCTGVTFPPADQVGDPWGRVPVTAEELAGAYRALLGDRTPAAAAVRAWMLAVPDEHTFGGRAAFATAEAVHPTAVMAKSGWFSAPEDTGIRTHVVLAHGTPDRFTGVAVTTFVATTAADREMYRSTYVLGPEVLPIHRAAAGSLIAAAVTRR